MNELSLFFFQNPQTFFVLFPNGLFTKNNCVWFSFVWRLNPKTPSITIIELNVSLYTNFGCCFVEVLHHLLYQDWLLCYLFHVPLLFCPRLLLQTWCITNICQKSVSTSLWQNENTLHMNVQTGNRTQVSATTMQGTHHCTI